MPKITSKDGTTWSKEDAKGEKATESHIPIKRWVNDENRDKVILYSKSDVSELSTSNEARVRFPDGKSFGYGSRSKALKTIRNYLKHTYPERG